MVCSCWPSDSSRRRTSMSKYIPGNQKHLTLEDRKYIEKSLNAGCSFKDIARYLCKDPTTISKEIRLHRLSDWYHKGCFNNAHNFCVHRYHCKKVNACGKIILCGVKCTTCPTCNQTCPDFVKERCNRLDKAPYVCNGCPKAINHWYKECLSQSRAGINMTRHELHQKDMVITPLIFQGQSPYQIITNHPELDMSVRTLYSYLDKGILSARNIDLKRQVIQTPQSTQDPDQRQIRFYQTYVFWFSSPWTWPFCWNGYRSLITGLKACHPDILLNPWKTVSCIHYEQMHQRCRKTCF